MGKRLLPLFWVVLTMLMLVPTLSRDRRTLAERERDAAEKSRGASDAELIRFLRPDRDDLDGFPLQLAAEAELVRRGETSIEPLAALVRETRGSLEHHSICNVMAAIGGAAVPALVELSEEGDRDAFHALARAGERGCSLVLAMLEGADSGERRRAAEALREALITGPATVGFPRRVGPWPEEIRSRATDALLAALEDGDRRLRARAAAGLEVLTLRRSVDDPRIISALVRALEDGAAEVRRDAAWMLAKYGAEAKGALPRLRRLEKEDPSEAVREGAWVAVYRIETAAAAD